MEPFRHLEKKKKKKEKKIRKMKPTKTASLALRHTEDKRKNLMAFIWDTKSFSGNMYIYLFFKAVNIRGCPTQSPRCIERSVQPIARAASADYNVTK